MYACVNVKLHDVLVQFRKTVYKLVENLFSNKRTIILLLLLLCILYILLEWLLPEYYIKISRSEYVWAG